MIKKILIWLFIAACVVGLVVIIIVGYDPGTTPTCTTPNASIRIKRDLYELCYSWQNKQPAWVLQFYDGTNSRVIHTEGVNLYRADPKIPQNDQASADDYESTDWVLGSYLFPFSKRATELTNESEELQYLFSVTSPQNADFHSGYWRKLRNYAREQANKSEFPAYIGVLSGPLFLSKNTDKHLGMLEPNDIPVPTHFFQVIIPNANENAIEAYIVPNRKISEEMPLDHFKYDLKDFEKKTGLKDVKKIARNLKAALPVP